MASVNFTAADLNLGGAAQGRVWYGHTHGRAPTARFYSPQSAQRVHGRVHMEFQRPVRACVSAG